MLRQRKRLALSSFRQRLWKGITVACDINNYLIFDMMTWISEIQCYFYIQNSLNNFIDHCTQMHSRFSWKDVDVIRNFSGHRLLTLCILFVIIGRTTDHTLTFKSFNLCLHTLWDICVWEKLLWRHNHSCKSKVICVTDL